MLGTGMVGRMRTRLELGPPSAPAVARREVLHFLRRLVFLIAALALLVGGGAGAFAIFEDVSYWTGFQWSLDTITTVGSAPHPDEVGSEVTKVVLVVLGVGTMFFALVTLTELFVAGDLSGLLEAWRMSNRIAQLKDHYLICGFGRVGRQVARDLNNAGVPFVVLDDNPEVAEAKAEMGVLHIEGRASDDAVLMEAGVERARAMIACVDSDAENIFATLTARQLRPDLRIVARAAEEASEPKLRAAGATAVVSPYKTSGHAMAGLALDAELLSETAEAAAEESGAVSGVSGTAGPSPPQ
jgi:voltage-gated potassium channel